MKKDTVLECLCHKDPRNPVYHDLYDVDDEPPTPRDDCFCDNCFYRRDALALEILQLRSTVAAIVEAFDAPTYGDTDAQIDRVHDALEKTGARTITD